MDDLNVGTKETISVDLTDRLGTITDLATYAVDYRVAKEDGSDQQAWGSVQNKLLMRVDCLIDTTTPSSWAAGHYELYVRPTIGAERPIIGPFDFDLV